MKKKEIVKPTKYNITKGDNHPDIMCEKIKDLEERIEELENELCFITKYNSHLLMGANGERYNQTIISKPDLLTPEEKEYLSAVIKPFRNIIESITKYSASRDREFISINYCDGNWFTLPSFSANKYYKNFKKDHSYTLKELGL